MMKKIKKGIKKGIKTADLTLFTRKLATLVSAGIPLAQAIQVISQSSPRGSLYSLLQHIKKELERGQAFSWALKKHPQYFNKLYCGLIEIGELSGNLDTILNRLATNQEKSEALKRKLKTALIYPILIFCVALSITTFLLISIVPIYKEMFQSFRLELPLATKILLQLSDICRNDGCWLLPGLTLCFFLSLKLYRTNKKIQQSIQYHSLRLPLLGPLIIKSEVAAITRILATTEAAGVPLTKALETLVSITPNIVFVQAINHIRLLLGRGYRLQAAMQETPVFPSLVQQMIGIGEESGTLDSILEKLSAILDAELEAELGQLTTLVEPLMMILLGLLVGGLVLALYLPIFNMGSLF